MVSPVLNVWPGYVAAAHFAGVLPEHALSLTVYTAVLVFSASVDIAFLFGGRGRSATVPN